MSITEACLSSFIDCARRLGLELPTQFLVTTYCSKDRPPDPAHLLRHATLRMVVHISFHPRNGGTHAGRGKGDDLTEITNADRSTRSMSCTDPGSSHGTPAVGAPVRSISTTRRGLGRPRWLRCGRRRTSRRRRAKPELSHSDTQAVGCRLVWGRQGIYIYYDVLHMQH